MPRLKGVPGENPGKPGRALAKESNKESKTSGTSAKSLRSIAEHLPKPFFEEASWPSFYEIPPLIKRHFANETALVFWFDVNHAHLVWL
jgi:hypothetical protein